MTRPGPLTAWALARRWVAVAPTLGLPVGDADAAALAAFRSLGLDPGRDVLRPERLGEALAALEGAVRAGLPPFVVETLPDGRIALVADRRASPPRRVALGEATVEHFRDAAAAAWTAAVRADLLARPARADRAARRWGIGRSRLYALLDRPQQGAEPDAALPESA